MGRQRIEVDRNALVNTINEAENEQTFASRKALFDFVAGLFGIESSTVYNRVREWEIPLKTSLGKRGRPANPNGNTPKKAQKSESPDFSELIAAFAGISIQSTADILTSQHKTPEQNAAIKQAWSSLRLIVDCPMPEKRVG
jgi:hypothetical protein